MWKIADARFETSAADQSGWPQEGLAEVAFVGRSNVGKSSLLNALVERKGLARTSREPGRTRLINFFIVDLVDGPERRTLRFVDLPGFGYAKVSKTERSTWRPTIERYLAARKPLVAVALLIDVRRVPMTKDDAARDTLIDELELAPWIASRGVRVIPVITKVDKLAKHERLIVGERLKRLLGVPPLLWSALSGEGRDKLLARVVQSAAAPTDAAHGEPATAEPDDGGTDERGDPSSSSAAPGGTPTPVD